MTLGAFLGAWAPLELTPEAEAAFTAIFLEHAARSPRVWQPRVATLVRFLFGLRQVPEQSHSSRRQAAAWLGARGSGADLTRMSIKEHPNGSEPGWQIRNHFLDTITAMARSHAFQQSQTACSL